MGLMCASWRCLYASTLLIIIFFFKWPSNIIRWSLDLVIKQFALSTSQTCLNLSLKID
uniref:Uncharacterized protein n=1 Tax=Rhizophora mucronata TaxID=61149 RepID=A0A2P2PNI2_RHIMU